MLGLSAVLSHYTVHAEETVYTYRTNTVVDYLVWDMCTPALNYSKKRSRSSHRESKDVGGVTRASPWRFVPLPLRGV